MSANLRAFLFMLRWCEGTADENGYRALFGHTVKNPKLFAGWREHPQVRTYEKYDGQFIENGKLDFTTAAGAYQITYTTWRDFIAAKGPHDFDPAGQDACAIWLMEVEHALEDVEEGRLRQAIEKCGGRWASLPSSRYPQPKRSYEACEKVYLAAGGLLTRAPADVAEEPEVSGPPPSPSEAAGAVPSLEPAPEQPQAKEEGMLPALLSPFVAAAIPALIEAAGAAAPSLIRIFGTEGSKITERNAKAVEEVVKVAKAVTGAVTVEQAVDGLKTNPTARANYERSLLEEMDRIMGIVARGVEIDDTSRDRAAERAKGMVWDPLPFLADRGFQALGAAFIAQLILLALGFILKVPAEALMILLTLFVATSTKLVDRWGQLYDYRLGSSSGSKASGDAVRAIAEQRSRQ
jgi:muramidase (phage lysozyme)